MERESPPAPATYPPQIEEVYLALPSGLPQRVVELAREVTAEAETLYARALALEAYLRSFPYDLEVAKPPEGPDVADFSSTCSWDTVTISPRLWW